MGYITDSIEVTAPAVVKLFGDHAVLYGGISVAAAIELRSKVMIEKDESEESMLSIELQDLHSKASFDAQDLGKLYSSYESRDTSSTNRFSEYIAKNAEVNVNMLPSATIAAWLFEEYGANVLGKRVRITSNVPIQRGFASGAVCSTGFTVGMLKATGIKLSDMEIVDIARHGERVSHASEGAGKIDVATSYFGGYVSTIEGGSREQVNMKFNIVIIDTGPKKSTAEMVRKVREQYDSDRESTQDKINRINECTRNGLDALRRKDMGRFCICISKTQELLKELGVSSEDLDRAVEIAKKEGAYAKLSGGGGGGGAIAITDKPDKLIKVMKDNGFGALKAEVSLDGAKKYLE